MFSDQAYGIFCQLPLLILKKIGSRHPLEKVIKRKENSFNNKIK